MPDHHLSTPRSNIESATGVSDATAQATAHPGVTLKTGGVISGKPTVTGTFKITLSAKVGTAKAPTQAFSLVVKS